MAPKQPKIHKQAAASITRHTTFTIPETPGSATCQCHYGSIWD